MDVASFVPNRKKDNVKMGWIDLARIVNDAERQSGYDYVHKWTEGEDEKGQKI